LINYRIKKAVPKETAILKSKFCENYLASRYKLYHSVPVRRHKLSVPVFSK
jgi:hypothetical protein